tara:strand:+ start:154 stop:366 length:213 start_codon:yes stop_codon:yes gene_type:complete
LSDFPGLDNTLNIRKVCKKKKIYSESMKGKINPDDDSFDQSNEYFKKKDDTDENESEEYFPQETSKPPHY